MRITRAAITFITVVTLLWLSPNLAQAQVYGTTCPSRIDANDCVANDLQPTGAEIISGPAQCNEGDTFSATVRVFFDNGGGAAERYTVGFFLGENGASAVGGASCTFDSFQPVATPPGDNPLGGPYPELSGDSCGDIDARTPTYKDIALNGILCRDNDGDGNVDISYVLSWVNNRNQTSCTNPLDPAQFEPERPKCRSDLEYDLPIEVENPPSIEVGKGAFPSQIEEPGGLVRYAVTVVNTSPESTDPVEIVSFIDVVDGGPPMDVTGLLDCVVPFILAPKESKTCYFENPVNGVAGDVIPDTITVAGRDDEGQGVQGSDTASVEIIAPDLPPRPGDLRLIKFASPSSIDEPGGTAQYDVLVANVSPTPVTLNSLVDDIYGDLNGRGSCSVPQVLAGTNSLYFCAFKEQVVGQPGDTITDIITARGIDALGNVLEASDPATVTIDDVASEIELTKRANPESIGEPGGDIVYTLQIRNRSPVDDVQILSILDSQVAGTPSGCVLPQNLVPNEIYECSYTQTITGNAGDVVTNVAEASGLDDDGFPVLDVAAATVFVTGQAPDIEVVKLAVPPVALAAGGTNVNFLVAIKNVSTASDPVTITALTDAVDGGAPVSLDGVGTCDLTGLTLQPAPDPGSVYICAFSTVFGSGTDGVVVTDVVTASGEDDEGIPVTADDDATVTYVTLPSSDRQLVMRKIAAPTEVPEPGGQVTYTVLLANTTDSTVLNPDLTLTALDDDIVGDLFTQGNCGTLQNKVLIPATSAVDVATCSFTVAVSGNPGDSVTNVITATAEDFLNRSVQTMADATVTITDVPASIEVVKTASPVSVLEPGADVTFEILVINTSPADALTLSSLVDSVHGDLLANGLCPAPSTLFPGGNPYRCEFTVFVGGEPGFEERNTVVAAATDSDGNVVEGNDQETVTVLGAPASIQTIKAANPTSVAADGGQVSFTFTVANTSSVDTVTIDTLVDNVFGDLNGQGDCTVPQVIPPGDAYSCVFTTTLAGVLGETHLDEVTASGESDDGEPVASRANAIVRFVAAIERIPALGQAGLGALVLMMAWLGWRRMRAR